MPKIEYLEKRSIMLYRERFDALISRRRMDVRDLADEVASGVFSLTVFDRPHALSHLLYFNVSFLMQPLDRARQKKMPRTRNRDAEERLIEKLGGMISK